MDNLAVAVVVVLGRLIALVLKQAKEALSDIDVQTKRRYDLVKSVETVKGYATHGDFWKK
jgi:hypothetical protein